VGNAGLDAHRVQVHVFEYNQLVVVYVANFSEPRLVSELQGNHISLSVEIARASFLILSLVYQV
jgi:hypothetical protein